jgi:hypothetical protein
LFSNRIFRFRNEEKEKCLLKKEIALNKIKPYAKNPRTRAPESVAKIAASVKEYGRTQPYRRQVREKHDSGWALMGLYRGALIFPLLVLRKRCECSDESCAAPVQVAAAEAFPVLLIRNDPRSLPQPATAFLGSEQCDGISESFFTVGILSRVIDANLPASSL